MALGIQTDVGLIKPLEGAIVRRYTAGGTLTAGDCVALSSAGALVQADGNSSDPAADFVLGVVLQSVVSGQRADVVIFGPVASLTGATPGGYVYVSDTAGSMDQSSTANGVVGFTESATVLFVRAQKI